MMNVQIRALRAESIHRSRNEEWWSRSQLQVKELSEIFEAKATFLKDTPAFFWWSLGCLGRLGNGLRI